MDKTNFGVLFETINLETEEHLNAILYGMNKETALYILTQAVSYAYKRGAFSLGESEVISKSIRELNSIEVEKKNK
jgi:hypothetical protein